MDQNAVLEQTEENKYPTVESVEDDDQSKPQEKKSKPNKNQLGDHLKNTSDKAMKPTTPQTP